MKEHKTEALDQSIREEPERYTATTSFPTEPKGVTSTIVDVIGPYVLRKHRTLFKRLAEYDRSQGKKSAD